MRSSHRRIFRVCFRGLLYLYLGVAALHLLGQLGTIPRYGDTKEYLTLATVLKVDHYRGILYPVFLAGMDRLVGHSLLADYRNNTLHLGLPWPPASAIWVQVVQLLLFALALVYAVRAALSSSKGWRQVLLLSAIVFLDPVIAHLNESVLSDGLCLTCLLLMAGGLANLVRRRGNGSLAWSLVFVGGLGSSLLRVEKVYVVFAVLVLSALLLAWLDRRHEIQFSRKKTLALCVLALSVGIGAWTIGSAVYAPHWRWPTTVRWPREISWLHERIIRPHLHAVREDLPRDLQKLLTPDLAERYDGSVQGERYVMYYLCRTGTPKLEDVTHVMATTVLHKQTVPLAADVVLDGIGNLFITPVFYLTVGAYVTGGYHPRGPESANGNVWTYKTLARGRTQNALILIVLAGIAGMTATVLTAVNGLRAWRSGWRPRSREVAVLLPFVLLWIVNAGTLTAAVGLVHIRYGLVTHAVILGCVWYPALSLFVRGNSPYR